MNTKFRNALARVSQKVPPIWMMRQAGRYHSHYQGLRAKYSFEQLCRQPELAAEVALGPVQDFDFDVAILFSDILFPLDALGLGLSYGDKGPALARNIRSTEDLKIMPPWQDALSKLSFQSEALKLTRRILPGEKSLIGFVGGLWTLFVYSVEGGHAGSLIESKKRAALFPQFLEKMLPLIEASIAQQLTAGAEVVMIFDTAAGEVSPGFFRERIADSLLQLAHRHPGRLGYYSKSTQANFFTEEFLQAPWAGMGFDHRWNLADTFRLPIKGFVQGNFDQALLHMSPEDFDRELTQWLAPLKSIAPDKRAGWICGLGHGVLPATPERNVRRFVAQVREALS